MKPAWDKLEKEFASGNTVVGNVDCTQHQGLCQQNQVQGYPTVKYYMNGKWKDYQGGRDFGSLKSHATNTMGAKAIPCEVINNPSTGAVGSEGCSKKEKKFIEKMKVRDRDNLNGVIKILKTCVKKGKGEECRKATGSKLKLSTRKMDWVKTKLKLTKGIKPMSAKMRKAWEKLEAQKGKFTDLIGLLNKALKGDTRAANKIENAVDFSQLGGMKAEL